MKGCKLTACAFFLPLVAAAQDSAALPLPDAQQTSLAEPTVVPATTPQAAPRSVQQGTNLATSEQLIRTGIIMLDRVQQILSGINNAETAEAAVAPLMRMESALQEWARAFNALPPLSEAEQNAYEEVYLPVILKLNNRIRSQGERLASAEYYGSLNLPAALIRLALINR